MSIKKFAPYRKDSKNWDQKRATRLQELKGKLKDRGVRGGKDGEGEKEKAPKKRKGKKERMKEKAAANDAEVEGRSKWQQYAQRMSEGGRWKSWRYKEQNPENGSKRRRWRTNRRIDGKSARRLVAVVHCDLVVTAASG